MNSHSGSYTIFVLLKTLPAWLTLPRAQRHAVADAAFAEALVDGQVHVRHFDAEAFSAVCTDVAVFETEQLTAFYFVMERLRDSPLFAHPYFELVQIIPSIADGFHLFEAHAASK
ncbi:darcynin family protein [Frateuria aurantia]